MRPKLLLPSLFGVQKMFSSDYSRPYGRKKKAELLPFVACKSVSEVPHGILLLAAGFYYLHLRFLKGFFFFVSPTLH